MFRKLKIIATCLSFYLLIQTNRKKFIITVFEKSLRKFITNER
jgi:hypothetical protein